jgi:uncharacterized membrane protein YfcA
VGDVARIGDVQHQSQVHEVEAHAASVAFGWTEGYRSDFRIVTGRARPQLAGMSMWILIGATFLLAGTVKGVIGMGLPTVAMGVLALALPPAEAAAILVVPSFVTNVWQLMAGSAFGVLARRLWPTMLAVLVGTIAGAGVLAGNVAGLAKIGLGITLALYAAVGLAGFRWSVAPRHEVWLGPTIGVTTGLVTGATGVFVIPAVPYLQAIGLEKDELIQALGLSFTVSTVALAIGLLRVDAWQMNDVWTSLFALAPALAGMYAGQWLRGRFSAATFRKVFFAGLLLLGATLALA